MVGEFTEVESGKRNKRPELEKGFDHLQAAEGQAGNSKLDRLSRNLAFIAALMDP